MMRCWCLDTNILISALAFRGPEHHLLQQMQAVHDGFLWFPTLEREVTSVLQRKFPAIDLSWEDAFPEGFRRSVAEPPEALITQARNGLRDPKDAPILAAAWTYPVTGLITGDHDLLVLAHSVPSVPILTASQALAQYYLLMEASNDHLP